MTHKINTTLAIGILVLISMACNFSFSTANLSELKFGKDKDANGATTSFKPEDEIFSVTAVNNASGKNKVRFRLLFDKVEGGQSGAVAYKLDKEMTVEESRPIWFNFSVPGGFVAGSYKAECVLTDEDGKELDRKTGNFAVTGGSNNQTSKPDSPSSDNKKNDADNNQDKDSEEN